MECKKTFLTSVICFKLLLSWSLQDAKAYDVLAYTAMYANSIAPINRKADIRQAIVKIYTWGDPYRVNTWMTMPGKKSSGSGCIMEGNIILTSAHVVAGQSHIEVRKFGAAQKYEAHVLSLSYESDLALLRVDDDSFFGGVSVLRMGKVPGNCEMVKILGFPGGENLIITNGTFAEINHQYYQFSGSYLPAGEIRAIIRPGNSGGPVVIDDKVVGIVMQISRNDDICHMIPVNIIHQFIEDSKVSYHSWPDIPFL